MSKEACEYCGNEFEVKGDVDTLYRHHYIYTVELRKELTLGAFEVDKFYLCAKCSNDLYALLQARGYRPQPPEECEEDSEMPESLRDLMDEDEDVKEYVDGHF